MITFYVLLYLNTYSKSQSVKFFLNTNDVPTIS